MLDELNRLVAPPPAENRLPNAETPAPIRTRTGLERRTAGDINSADVTAQSTDGLFLFTVRVVK